MNPDGSFEYIPNAHFNGTDFFTYKVNVNDTYSPATLVKIKVNPVDDFPIAENDIYKFGWNESLSIDENNGVMINDTSIDAGDLSAILVNNVKYGSLTLNINGSFTYIPNVSFSGIDSFTYKIFNGTLDSEPAEVQLVVDKIVTLEDAQSDSTELWGIYDKKPAGTVKLISDPDNPENSVIALSGGKTSTGYRCTFSSPVKNSFIVQWRMKYSENYVVYFSCLTTAGHRYIYYTPSDKDMLNKGRYVHHGLGRNTVNENWITIRRNLQRDLQEAQPNNKLISIDAFLIRGSGLVDDIASLQYKDNDNDIIPDYVEIDAGLNPDDPGDAYKDNDNDKLSNYEEFVLGTNIANPDTDHDNLPDNYEIYCSNTNPKLTDSDNNSVTDDKEDPDNDGLSNYYEFSIGLDPLKTSFSANGYVYDKTVYDFADSSTLDRWDIYDNTPMGKISIISNTDIDDDILKLSASGGTATGFRYTFPNPETKEFKVRWRMKYSGAFVVYISCMTTAGHRYIYYNNADKKHKLGVGKYVHHGLGNYYKGNWTTFTRDLQRDLKEAQPGNEILYIEAFLIRGNGLVDYVSTLFFADVDKDMLPDQFEINNGLDPVDSSDANKDSDGDGLSNIDEFNAETNINKSDTDNDGLNDFHEIKTFKTDPLKMDSDGDGTPDGNEDSDGDGFSDFDELNNGTDPFRETTQTEHYTYEIIMHENAETGDIGLWDVYDKTPEGIISNIIDPDNSDNCVISFMGGKTNTGYRCTFIEPGK